VSKTRNLSDLLDANGDVKSTALDNVPASNDASALTTGTLDSARLGTITNFTSTGIDDNATSTAITIDSSENVFVKPTGIGTNIGIDAVSTGYYLRDGGQFRVARDNSQSIIANRLNGDGLIIDLRKDGTEVGSIGTRSGDLTIFSTATNHTGFRFAGSTVFPTGNTGIESNNTMDFGTNAVRFRNAYLAGGIYLGGSTSALDDYEEGTWTPTLSGTTTGTTLYGWYIKIGSLVCVRADIYSGSFSSSSGVAKITNLPFTVNTSFGSAGVLGYNNSTTNSSNSGFFDQNKTEFIFYDSGTINTSTFSDGTGKYFIMTGTYKTN